MALLSYESLKAAIYRFEKAVLLNGPAVEYSDREPTPSAVEAGAGPARPGSTNEKIFVRLLDQELHKIATFYGEKEHELRSDLESLLEDIRRIEQEEEDDNYATSGADTRGSDSEDEGDDLLDGEGDQDGGVAAKLKSTLTNVFISPSAYSAATKAGRRQARSTSTKPNKPTRPRAASSASHLSEDSLPNEADLLNLGAEEPTAGETNMTLTPQRPRKTLRSRSSYGLARSGRGQSSTSGTRARTVSPADEMAGEGVGVWQSGGEWGLDRRIMYKKRVAALFTSLSELKQYVDLNYTGLGKVIKKYDKITHSDLRGRYMAGPVAQCPPFTTESRAALQSAISSLVPIYADLSAAGDVAQAEKQLKAHLREHVVWERNTVWREMIGLERRGWGGATSRGGIGPDGGSGAARTDLPLIKGEASSSNGNWPAWVNSQTMAGGFALVMFAFILNGQWFDRVEEQNCLALLAFVTVMWALEVIPLFVTALIVPFLVVVLRVLRSVDGEDRRLTAGESTKYIFGQMFSPTIMLLLGGFTLAAALSKQNIDKVLATQVLSFAGTKPRNVLLAYMCVACFASMWISNVAAPVLCYSLIQPILRTLPPKSSFSKALILGIALASNIGGMASPISSPQNLIALEYMNPAISWLGWFAVSIPVASTSIFCIWLGLLWSYRSGQNVTINPVRINREKWTATQWFVAVVTIATIVLWCIESKLAWLFGDMGIIAILPIVLFYGSGVLRKADFDHSPWSIVFLAMGGIALGKAVLSSGLLDDLDRVIQHAVLGLDIWPILALFSVVVLLIATLISHTIASVLVVPIAAQIGTAMEVPHPNLLILASALICSAGMGLPISGFPNLQAINQEDDMGERYLEPSDFFKNGIPSSVVATVVIITVGYGIMRLMGL